MGVDVPHDENENVVRDDLDDNKLRVAVGVVTETVGAAVIVKLCVAEGV